VSTAPGLGNATIVAALAYAARGWPVFPLQPAVRGVKESGKRPITAHGVKDATTDEGTIRRWWTETPTANVGIACGARLVVIDIDTATPPAPFDALPESMVVRTGRGIHVYLDPLGETFPNRAGIAPGVDVRSAGGYVVAPPSAHYTGSVYEWTGGEELAVVPESWLPLMRAKRLEVAPRPVMSMGGGSDDLRRAAAYLAAIPGAVSGAGGHAQTFTAAQAMVRGFALSEVAAQALLMSGFNPRCDPPWSAADMAHKVASAAAQGSMPYGSLRDVEREPPMRRSTVVPMRAQDSPPERDDVPWPDDEWMPSGVGPMVPTPFVADLLEKNSRAAAHWRGRGKANGDTSARGYDIAIARDVFQAGGTADDTRSAVLSRPDGHAATMPAAYLADVLGAAQRDVVPSQDERADQRLAGKIQAAVDLVTAVTLYRTDPPTYALTVRGVTFDTSAAVIISRARMVTRIVEATNSLPDLPRKGYDLWVAAILEMAEIVKMPEDASEAGGILADLSYMLEGLAPGDDLDALERGCVYIDDAGDHHIMLRAFARGVAATLPKLTRPMLCKMLRVMGWTDVQTRIGASKQTRLWRKSRE